MRCQFHSSAIQKMQSYNHGVFRSVKRFFARYRRETPQYEETTSNISQGRTENKTHRSNMSVDNQNNVSVQPIYTDVYSWGWNNLQVLHDLGDDTEKPTAIRFDDNSSIVPPNICYLATGGSHSVIITHEGIAYTFGRNQSGQLGLGHTNDCEKPQPISALKFDHQKIVHASCGDRHSVFVTERGLVYVCGHSYNYQLGLGMHCSILEPMLVDHLKHRSISFGACGSRHTILVDSKGNMYSAGYGYYGQNGNGDHRDQTFFKRIEVDWRVRSLSIKEHVNIALSDDWSVYVWGGRTALDNDQNSPFSSPVFVCRNICGRRVQEIAASSKHFLCRTSDGSLYGFGFDLQNLGYTRYVKKLASSDTNDHVLTIAEQDMINKKLDLSSKYVIHHESKMKELTLYKNHFISSDDKPVSIACTSTANFVVTESGRVFDFGVCNFGELGLGQKEMRVDYPTELIASNTNKKVVDVRAGNFHVFSLLTNHNNS